MNPLQSITEDKIRVACGETIFERAFEYACTKYLRQRVFFPKISQVRAQVEGNYGNYVAGFQPLKNGQIHTFCSCPAEMPFCKHAAALGIAWIREPESFFNMDSLTEILKGKSRPQLEELIVQILSYHTDCLCLLDIEGFEDEDEYEEE